MSRTALEPASIDVRLASTSPSVACASGGMSPASSATPVHTSRASRTNSSITYCSQHAPALSTATFDGLVYERHCEHHDDQARDEAREQGVVSPERPLERVGQDAADQGEQGNRRERASAAQVCID